MAQRRSADGRSLGIFEILLFLVIALIVIPPDDLPQVMRAVGKVMRELRLASNTVMREISGAIGDDSPFNILPPRFDDPHPPPVPPASPSPPPPAFLAPEPQAQAPDESAPPAEAAPISQASAQVSVKDPRATGELHATADHQPTAEPQTTADLQAPAEPQIAAESQPPPRPRRTRKPKQPSPPEGSVPPADKP